MSDWLMYWVFLVFLKVLFRIWIEECEERRALEGVKVRSCVKQRCRRSVGVWGRVKESEN